MTTADTLDEVLFHHLHFWLAQLPPTARSTAHWVMSPEWLIDCRKATRAGLPIWLLPVKLTDPELLFGLPVEIRDGSGPPHLEQAGHARP